MISKEMLRMLKWTPKPFRWRIYALMEMYGNYMSKKHVSVYISAVILWAIVMGTVLLNYVLTFIGGIIAILGGETVDGAVIGAFVICIVSAAFAIVYWGLGAQLILNPYRKSLMVWLLIIDTLVRIISHDGLLSGHLTIPWSAFILIFIAQYPKLPRRTDAQKELYAQIKHKYKSERHAYREILESFTFREPPYAYVNVQPVYGQPVYNPVQQAPYNGQYQQSVPYQQPTGQSIPYQQPMNLPYGQQSSNTGYNMPYQQPVCQLTPYQQYQQLTGQPVTQYQQPVVQPNTYQQPVYQQPYMQQPMMDMPQQPVQQNTFEIPKVDDFEQSNPFSEENFGESTEASDASFASDGSDDLWS